LSEEQEQELGSTSTASSGNIYGLHFTLPLPEGSPLPPCATPFRHMPIKRIRKNKAGTFPAIRNVLKVHDAQCSLDDSRRLVGTVGKIFVKKFGFINCLGGGEVFFHLNCVQKGETLAKNSVVEFTLDWDVATKKQIARDIKVVENPKKQKQLLKGEVAFYDSRSGFGFITPDDAPDGLKYFFMNQDVRRDLHSADLFVDRDNCDMTGYVVEFLRAKFATPKGQPRAYQLRVTAEPMDRLPRGSRISNRSEAGTRKRGGSRLAWN